MGFWQRWSPLQKGKKRRKSRNNIHRDIYLSQQHACHFQYIPTRFIHRIRPGVYHLFHSHLSQFHAASQTRTTALSSESNQIRNFIKNQRGRENNAHVLQYRIPITHLSLPASNRAFSSAWRHRHSSNLTPDLTGEARTEVPLHRGQPPALQFSNPRGVPLYPVDISRLDWTRIAPTLRSFFHQSRRRREEGGDIIYRRFIQLDRLEANSANVMK